MKPRFRNQRTQTIPQRSVDLFRGRQLDSFDFLKLVPKKDLLDEAHRMGMRFTSDPWHQQLVCFLIGAQLARFLYFLKMGGGKSRILLDLIRYRKRRGELDRAIILAPYELHVGSWEEQIKTHAPDLSYHLLLGDRSDRHAAITKKRDVFVMNYRGMLTFMAKRVSRRNVRTGEDKEFFKIDPRLASEFACLFNFVGIDELHKTVDLDSSYYEAFRWLSLATQFCYALTGTPFGRTPEPLWGQFNLVDLGETLGETPGLFHHAFFRATKHPFKGTEWKFRKSQIGHLHQMIKHRSITYEVTEYQEMPKKLLIGVPVRLRGESEAYYRRIVDGLIEARGDYRSMGNVFVRMRQCASGFLSLKADDASRIEIQFADNPKLDALHQFSLSKPNEKIIVFHEYTHSGRFIEKMLDQSGTKYASIRGETQDVMGNYRRFLDDPKCMRLVLNNSLGSEAINPQYVCRRAAVYESPVDPKKREQLEMRVWRPGQLYTTFIHDFTVLGTVEEKVRRYNREGRDLLRAVLTGDASLIPDEE